MVTDDERATREWAEQLVARARAEGVELTGDDGLLTTTVLARFRRFCFYTIGGSDGYARTR